MNRQALKDRARAVLSQTEFHRWLRRQEPDHIIGIAGEPAESALSSFLKERLEFDGNVFVQVLSIGLWPHELGGFGETLVLSPRDEWARRFHRLENLFPDGRRLSVKLARWLLHVSSQPDEALYGLVLLRLPTHSGLDDEALIAWGKRSAWR